MIHAYVRDGLITATSRAVILAAIQEDGGGQHDDGWFDRTPAAEKKAAGVYEVIDTKPSLEDGFATVFSLPLHYDRQADTVTQPYTVHEMDVDAARATLRRRITEKHRDLIRNGQADLAGRKLSTHNEAFNELEKAVERAAKAPFKAVTRDGDVITFDSPTAQAALASVSAYREACVDREAALYETVNSAADLAALRAVEIEAGWP